MNLLTSLIFEYRRVLWRHPDYILTKSYLTGGLGWFIICMEYNFTDAWYSYFQHNAHFDKELNQLKQEINHVNLHEPVQMKTRFSYIGKKTLQEDTEYISATGIMLASSSFLYALVDLEQRKVIPLPDEFQKRAKNIKTPAKPMYVKLEYPPNAAPTGECMLLPSTVDSNGHINFSSYLEVALGALKMVIKEPKVLQKFVVLWKNESFLGDVLASRAWKGDLPGQYRCVLSIKDNLVVFCEATYTENTSKL